MGIYVILENCFQMCKMKGVAGWLSENKVLSCRTTRQGCGLVQHPENTQNTKYSSPDIQTILVPRAIRSMTIDIQTITELSNVI